MTCIENGLVSVGKELLTSPQEAEKNLQGGYYVMHWGMPSILIYSGRELLIRRTGVAEINSQGEKYYIYQGTPSILVSGGKVPNNVRTGVAEINLRGEKYDMYQGTLSILKNHQVFMKL
jgi:hypothetical protein